MLETLPKVLKKSLRTGKSSMRQRLSLNFRFNTQREKLMVNSRPSRGNRKWLRLKAREKSKNLEQLLM